MNLDLKKIWSVFSAELEYEDVAREFLNIRDHWNSHDNAILPFNQIKLIKGILGTNTNDSAVLGFVGEYVESVISSPQNLAATGQYSDLTSVSLTAGDWNLTGIIEFNGTITGTATSMLLGTVAGNNSTGIAQGSNNAETPTVPTVAADVTLNVPNYRVSLSSTTTYYLKMRMVYSAGTPQARGRISARRIR